MYFDIQNWFVSPGHVTGQATEGERKLKNSHYDNEMKGWDWDKYVTLHKEKHMIMQNLKDHGWSGIDNDTNVCHFLQGVKSSELEADINVIKAKLEKYSKDFSSKVSYLGQMVTNKTLICNLSQLLRPAVSWQSLKWEEVL